VYDEPATTIMRVFVNCAIEDVVKDLTSGLLMPMPKATVAQTILILSSIHSRCTCMRVHHVTLHA
jgi:hypothetical protein